MHHLAFSYSSISLHPGHTPTSSFLFTHPPHPVIHSGCFTDPLELPHGTLAAAFSRTVHPQLLHVGSFSQPAHTADAWAPQVSSQITARRHSTPLPTPLHSHLAPSLVCSASHSDEQRLPSLPTMPRSSGSNSPSPTKQAKIYWDRSYAYWTDHFIEWCQDNPMKQLKLFSDSTQDV